MVIGLFIYTTLILLRVGARFCFDDPVGYIDVTLTSELMFREWSLLWTDGYWWNIHRRQSGVFVRITARGCSSGGVFYVKRSRRGVLQQCPFAFGEEDVNVICSPRVAYCAFPVKAQLSGETLYVTGSINCNCVGDYAEMKDVPLEDSEMNATLSAPIESLIELEYEHSFN